MNGAWAMIKPRFATSMVSWMILAVQRKVLDFCLNNDSCTSSLQQMYNTPSHGVGPTHLLYTWCTGITSLFA
jgi:hypothetical protein